MTSSLSKINDPWLQIVTGARASLATVTTISTVAIGLLAALTVGQEITSVYFQRIHVR